MLETQRRVNETDIGYWLGQVETVPSQSDTFLDHLGSEHPDFTLPRCLVLLVALFIRLAPLLPVFFQGDRIRRSITFFSFCLEVSRFLFFLWGKILIVKSSVFLFFLREWLSNLIENGKIIIVFFQLFVHFMK